LLLDSPQVSLERLNLAIKKCTRNTKSQLIELTTFAMNRRSRILQEFSRLREPDKGSASLPIAAEVSDMALLAMARLNLPRDYFPGGKK
jgi:hypothetical protein